VIARRILFLVIACFFYLASGQTAPRSAVAVETAPYFDKPELGLLPKGYIGKRDSCTVDSAFVDSAGMPWFCIRVKNSAAWMQAASLRYATEVGPDFFSLQAKGEEDKKRRLEILQKHPEWPHRIKKAARNGQVCLDMSEEQLIASWGKPVERKKSFMIGVGDYVCLVYKGGHGSLIVALQNDRVIGWSRE
jgi:hypothetical protein